jgi:exodeoxyribonuclease V alpha subunit
MDAIEGIPGTAFEGEVVVSRLRWSSADTGFAIVEADREGDELILVGTLSHLEQGERVQVSGTWEDDKRYGLQVKVSASEALAPSGTGAIVAYLRRVRHLGTIRAAKLVDHYGEETLEVIDRDPRRAFKVVGVSARRIDESVRSWDKLRSTRALHLLLAPHGLAWLVPRLAKHYGEGAHRIVAERPYDLTSVFGVGFSTADVIAQGTGIQPGDPQRVRAGVMHVLSEAERDGSTCLPVREVFAAAETLLGAGPDAALLQEMADAGDVVLEIDADQNVWAYRKPIARLEAELAEMIQAMIAGEASALLSPPEPPGEEEWTPAPEQAAAVQAAFTSRLSIVTGGPGTGKTATIRWICEAAKAQDVDVLLVAPTGRAARRVSESTGLEASTVHSALSWVPGQGPTRDQHSRLREEILVVDETSMANLELLVTLMRAVGPRMHVVLVGDADQLAPVGAGKPFAELVESRAVPTAELTHIFRQAAGSMIVRGAHAVRTGQPPNFEPSDDVRRDLFLIERNDAQAALEEIVTLVSERLPKHYGVDPVSEIQVFAPVYRGELGIDAINRRVREALNPGGRPVLGGRLRIGDKLMLAGRNLHELGLMNGTTLRLLDHDEAEEVLVVEADGVTVQLPEEEANKLQLAYACSVHKGQGIELPIAVLVAHPAAGAFFLRREMLYTAMTRARVATIVVGQRGVVARAAATPDTARRYSRLGARLAHAVR